MYQPCVTLQIISEVGISIYDIIKVVNRSFIIAVAKVKGSYFVINNGNPVLVYKQCILFQLFFYIRNKGKTFVESTTHKMLIKFRAVYVYEGLYAKVIMLHRGVRFRELLKLVQCFVQHPKVAQVEMSIQQVMHSLYIMACFNAYHYRFFSKKVYPLLCITIIQQKVLSYES